MSTSTFLRVIEEALGLAEGTVSVEDRIADIEGWDSVGALSVLALLDEEYGVALDAGSLQKCRTLHELADLVIGSGE